MDDERWTSHAHFAVLADDLTGACDAGSEMLPLGEVCVIVDATAPPENLCAAETVVVLNSQTRTLSAAQARERVVQILGSEVCQTRRVLLKKIDTSFRGHVREELQALLDARPEAGAWIAPAIPCLGRTTLDGQQYFDGEALPGGYIPDRLSGLGPGPIPWLGRADLAQGVAGVVSQVQSLRQGQVRVIGFDTACEAELDVIAVAFWQSGPSEVAVGSVGIARSLAQAVGAGTPKEGARPLRSTWRELRATRATRPTEGIAGGFGLRRVLIISGSSHPATKRQLHELERAGVRRAGTGGKVELHGVPSADHLTVDLSDILQDCSVGDLPVRLREVAERAYSWVQSGDWEGLMVVGGETFYALAQRLGLRSLRVLGAVRPAVVCSEATISGRHLIVVSKGGTVGGDDDLVFALRRLEAS